MYWTLKRMLGWLAISLFVGSIFYYAYYQSRNVLAGPRVVISTPQNGENVTTSLLRIAGVATRAKELTIDGRGIFVDLQGNFDEELLLADGYNIIEIVAKDAEGHETRQTIEIVRVATSTRASFSSTSVHTTIATGTTTLSSPSE
jgi:hypothetical protein